MRISDWSSDVCSSYLLGARLIAPRIKLIGGEEAAADEPAAQHHASAAARRIATRCWSRACAPSSSTAAMITSPLITICQNALTPRSEEHTSELQSLMRISYAVFCLTKKLTPTPTIQTNHKRTNKHI